MCVELSKRWFWDFLVSIIEEFNSITSALGFLKDRWSDRCLRILRYNPLLLELPLPSASPFWRTEEMKNDILYYLLSTIATFCICSGASSSQSLSLNVQPVDAVISILSAKPKVGTADLSCTLKPKTSITSTKRNNIRETFFTRMNEHNTEAFNLLNQLWHSKSGWQHVNTKEGT